MKKHTLTTLPVLLALFLGGCEKPVDEQAGEAYDNTTDAVTEAAEQTGDTLANAWDDVAGYTAKKKDDFVSALEDGYEGMKQRASQWSDDSPDISEQAKEQFQEAGEAFQTALDNAGEASGDAWDSTKETVGEAWNNLRNAYDNLREEAGG